MSPLDAAFLQAEDEEPGVSLAIASIAVFEGPPPASADFEAMIAGRLPLVPRYRQKAREVPLDLGPPVWVDDRDFDLGYHLRRTALPSPGGDEELATLMGRIMSTRLDRDRPLWEYWLVEGLAEDRWALISKVHHCMVDGVSGTDLYRVVLDETPEPGAAVADDWHPGAAPSPLRLAAAAALDAARLPLRQARAVTGALRRPTTLLRQTVAAAQGVTALAGALRPAAASSLSGRLSAHRRFAFARTSAADVGAVRHALGGTFNDVVLAAVTAGFRHLLLSRGELPTEHTVRTLVPVSVRAPGTESIRDNQVSMLLPELPVHLADPVERLVAVRQHLDRAKAEHEADAGAVLVQLARQEPFLAAALPVRWAARLPQRSVVTVTTNVPGPRTPLYALGRRLLEIIPYVPIGSTMRTGVAIFSYCGQVTFGVTGDRDAAADVWALAQGIEAGLGELRAAAGAAVGTHRRDGAR
ncbi:WS/DGAT/MGAT family O-acyltransferase [Blastococcus sp. VKM Ac-2987]|uniref:WS/DGAT/MGAT family O-acyltransferase n=1 Tax=Blastococcus sp. VKM Ac-2987 TaxID=3004141 RepID=UPI0022AB7BA3|nr:wax ester/triacylglycerol synthase family O-acyltransferase [Blastococcus sp. VKM Ac-2987]MCZ2860618.1 wax ester/triacylglycerol synthase family O-acyltransferase [Blastococcus sp. VKM Ac-2987]